MQIPQHELWGLKVMGKVLKPASLGGNDYHINLPLLFGYPNTVICKMCGIRPIWSRHS